MVPPSPPGSPPGNLQYSTIDDQSGQGAAYGATARREVSVSLCADTVEPDENGLIRCPACCSTRTWPYRTDVADLEYVVLPGTSPCRNAVVAIGILALPTLTYFRRRSRPPSRRGFGATSGRQWDLHRFLQRRDRCLRQDHRLDLSEDAADGLCTTRMISHRLARNRC
jgi:hypothetical protein